MKYDICANAQLVMSLKMKLSALSKLVRHLPVLCLALSAPLHAIAVEASERGKQAAATCIACHQADGNGLDSGDGKPWPRLAGLDVDYLQKQLLAFRDGSRVSNEMKPFADLLTDDQVKDVSLYYASLEAKMPPAPEAATPELLKAGERLATAGDSDRYILACASCHGPGKQGVGSQFPDIAGQHANYIADQLHAWREGTRTGDPLALMQAVSRRMNDDDILAVSVFLATQPPAERTHLREKSNDR